MACRHSDRPFPSATRFYSVTLDRWQGTRHEHLRLIDFALIGLTTLGLGAALTRGLDWLSLLEAINLHVDHPTVPIAARATAILALWLASYVLTLLIVRGRTDLTTTGKWLCGLRMLRSILKPCGFARSLAREVVLCVDACHFLCWAPGIVTIPLTDCRQRLGDLVADTLVVEAKSLKSACRMLASQHALIRAGASTTVRVW